MVSQILDAPSDSESARQRIDGRLRSKLDRYNLPVCMDSQYMEHHSDLAKLVWDGTELTHWYFLYGSMSLSFFLMTFAIKLKRKLFDFIHAWIIFVRIVATFTLMYLVSTGTEGF